MKYTNTFKGNSGFLLKYARICSCAVACLLLSNNFANAQGVSVGVTSGGALNSFNNQPQTGFNVGYTGGIFANYSFNESFSLQLEANYLQQGGQLISFKDDTRYGLEPSFATKNVKNSSFLLNSIEVPLLAQYKFNINQSWRPIVYLGGSAAYNVSAYESYEKTGDLLPGEDIIATVNGRQFVNNRSESMRFSALAGAGIELPLTAGMNLMIDFRYVMGLSAAQKKYSYTEKVGFGTDIYTNSFISRIGLVFPIK